MEKTIAQLEEVLHAEIAAHERLLAAIRRKVDACRKARRDDVEAQCRLENQELQALAQCEKQRLQLVADLTRAIDPGARKPLRMGEMAAKLPEPARGRLTKLRDQLRASAEQVKRDSGVARQAAEALMRHMQGIVQAIGGAITGIVTYNRRGSRPPAAVAVSTFFATA